MESRDPESVSLPRCLRCGRRCTLYGPASGSREALEELRRHSRCRLCRVLAGLEGAFSRLDARSTLALRGIQALESLHQLLSEYIVDRNVRRRRAYVESEDDDWA